MELWNRERHHNAVHGFYKLKHAYYSTCVKLFDENITVSERRSLKKVLEELSQNITEYQRDNAYYLELFNHEKSTA